MGSMDAGGYGIAHCPNCSTEFEHDVIKSKPKGVGRDLLVKCQNCGFVHNIILRPPKAILIKTTLSDGKNSSPAEIESDEDERISTGDVFEHGGLPELTIRNQRRMNPWLHRKFSQCGLLGAMSLRLE